MRGRFTLENVTAVLPDRVLPDASVRIEQGHIVEIRSGRAVPGEGSVLDGRGGLLFPGCVDLHSDAIEKEIEPRPRARFPVGYALHELDKRLAVCGVTTTFHSLSFAEGEIGTRSNALASSIVREVAARAPKLKVKTRVHARFEVTDSAAVPVLSELIAGGMVQLLSFMDHTPGQGQFRAVAAFKDYYGPVYGKSDAELDAIILRKQRMQSEEVQENVHRLLERARARALPLASHDLDAEEKVRWLADQGVHLTEFPVNLETLRAARLHGVRAMLGAPNVFRGASQVGNLSAREALALGLGDILCSDYAPQTLLHAVGVIARLGWMSLHEAVRLVSLHPAQAAGIADHTGSIEVGKEADLVLLDYEEELAHVRRTFVAGREVFATA